ncbi:mucin-12-like isoform X8 [Branchiostoma lanceolatum]|uniref:mucin-12-like isoform X8 n=1 Tax=Branchiostoma lanceolatum TaxID=7740 RepID=UPI003453463F
MRQKQAPLRVEDDIESEDITMAAAVSEDFHRESGDGLCGDFSCPHCAFSVDQDVMLKVLKHFFNCTSLQYIIDISVGNAATLGATKPPAPRRASKAPQPHSEPVRHSEPPTKRRATEARATPPQESPRIVTTQAPTLLARLNAAQSRTQTVHASSQREIPSEPEHHTRPVTTRQVETVQPRAPETTTTTTTAANIQLPSIPTIKEEPGAGAACIVEPTAPTLFDEPMHTQKDTDSAMGMKRDTDTVGGMLDALPGTSSSGLFSEDLNFGGAGPSFVQSDPSQEDSTSGNDGDTGMVSSPDFGLEQFQSVGAGQSLPITSAGPRMMETVSLEEDRTISIRQSVAGTSHSVAGTSHSVRSPGTRPMPSATVSKPGPEIEIVSVKSPATSRIPTGTPVRTTMQSSPQHLAQGQVNAGMGQHNPQPRIINTVSLSRPQLGPGQDRPTSRVAFPSTSQQTQQPRPVACFKAPMRELPTPLPLPDFANSEDTQLRHAARSGNLHMYRTHIVRECAKFYSRMKPNLSRQDYARIGEAMTTAYPWLQGKGATPWDFVKNLSKNVSQRRWRAKKKFGTVVAKSRYFKL